MADLLVAPAVVAEPLRLGDALDAVNLGDQVRVVGDDDLALLEQF